MLPGKVIPVLPVFIDLFQPDKIVHVIIFAVFVVLQLRGLLLQPVYPAVSNNALLITMLAAFTLAAGTELLQDRFIAMRIGSIYDFMANAAGCLAGWGISWRLRVTN
jgi:hypothetical protein